MTSYSLTIGGTPKEFVSLKFEKGNKDIPTWEALLSTSTATASKGASVIIYRDGIVAFKGILETVEPYFDDSGAYKKVSGRHTKVKLWRKWCERYVGLDANFTNYYPNKIVEFLIHPSVSEQVSLEEWYRKSGWGIDPDSDTSPWTATASSYEGSRGPQYVYDRLPTSIWRLNGNQTNGAWIKVDLGSTKSICGIRVMGSMDLYPWEFVRNYKIETSLDDYTYDERASKDKNWAINIVESWNAVNARYVKITCTANASVGWSVGEILIYESSGNISGIDVGTLDEHLPLNCSFLSSTATSGQKIVNVNDGWRFKEIDDVVIGDDNNEELNQIDIINGNQLTMKNNLSHTYTTGADAIVLDYDSYAQLDIDYGRRTERIDDIVSLCMTDNVPWIWEVTDDGEVNMGLRTGTDRSGLVSFTRGTNIISANSKEDDATSVGRVLVLGKGGDNSDEQDRNSSGWIGTGQYEQVITDSALESREACISKAKGILEQYENGVNEQVISVIDDHTIGYWDIDDDITITDSLTGMSGSYKVVKVIRNFSEKGEVVTINCTNEKKTVASIIADLASKIREGSYKPGMSGFPEITGMPEFILFYEAEILTTDPDALIVPNDTASNKKYVYMASVKSGDVWAGPVVPLKLGSYKAVFKCKVFDNTSASNLVTLDVYSATKGSTFTTLTLAPNAFNTSDTWQLVGFSFELDADYSDIEIRANNFQTGITGFSCDWVGVIFSGVTSVSELDMDYPAGAPATPTGLTITQRANTLLLTWTANSEFDLDHYEVYKNTVNNPNTATKIAEVLTNYFVYTATQAEIGATLYFWIKAVDWTGHISGFSTGDNEPVRAVETADLKIELKPWNSDISFIWDENNQDWDEIWWGEAGAEKTSDATITFADGTSTGVNNGHEAALADGVYFYYWDSDYITGGNFDLQRTTNYSTAVGEGKGLVAIVQIDEAESAAPDLLVFNGYTPTIGGGMIAAYGVQAKHITADWITGKKLRTSGRASGGAGVEISDSGFLGYNSNGTQVTGISTSTGIMEVRGTQNFTVKDIDGNVVGYLEAGELSGVDNIKIRGSASNQDALIESGGGYYWRVKANGDVVILSGQKVDLNNGRFIMQAVSSDPSSPSAGEMWLRTDL